MIIQAFQPKLFAFERKLGTIDIPSDADSYAPKALCQYWILNILQGLPGYYETVLVNVGFGKSEEYFKP